MSLRNLCNTYIKAMMFLTTESTEEKEEHREAAPCIEGACVQRKRLV